ncbi:MAG: leucine-rich repeat protein [Bacteroidetes bacterium]|nr:leucine-rich repeat protein [Bacteroidota bacterium]
MKKAILILIASIFAISLNSKAEDFSAFYNGDTIYYKITSSVSPLTVGVTFKGPIYYYYNEYAGSVSIPDSVEFNGNYYRVTSIDTSAFAKSRVMSVNIPNSVTYIAEMAFTDCDSLTSIIIPNSVTRIGSSVFMNSNYLTSVTIPNSVTEIGPGVFSGCSGLTSFTIPNSISKISNFMFMGCSGLTSLTIPNNITSIGYYSFRESGLSSLNIPNTVNFIDQYAFYLCGGLTSIDLPDSISFISYGTFWGCSALTSLTIPSTVDTIDDYAFYKCSGLTSIISEPTTPPVIRTPNSIFNINRAIPVYIPCGSLSSYQSAQYWSLFTNFIERNFQYIDTSICDGDSYNFNGTIIDSAGVYSYVSGCDSVILTLNITPIPIVPHDLSLSNIQINNVEISWQGDAESYDVYRDDSLIVNVTDTTYVDNFNFNNGQTYCYNIKAKNGSGCESALSDTNCFVIVGLENIENTNIQTKLYPNPTNNKSYLEIEGLTSEADVLVYDMVGRLIQKHKVNQGTKELEIDLSTYSKGVYSIRIVNESISQTKKLIVQ